MLRFTNLFIVAVPLLCLKLVVSAQEPDAEAAQNAEKKTLSIDEKLAGLVKKPDRETFLALRKDVIASKSFKPYSDEMDQADELYAGGKVKEARDLLLKSLDNLMLSPKAHARLSFYHIKLGDVEAARKEIEIAEACIKGILATGDGTKDKPYLVLRTDDEYEVVAQLKKQVSMQSLQFDGKKKLDVLTCKDKSQVYFDISDFFGKF